MNAVLCPYKSSPGSSLIEALISLTENSLFSFYLTLIRQVCDKVQFSTDFNVPKTQPQQLLSLLDRLACRKECLTFDSTVTINDKCMIS